MLWITMHSLYYLVIIALIIQISLRYKRILLKGKILLYILIIIISITEVAVDILKLNNRNHRFIYHFYIPIEYTLLSFFYAVNIRNRVLKSSIYISLALYLPVIIYISLQKIQLSEFPSFQFNITGLLLVIFSFLTIQTILFNNYNIRIVKVPIFWFCTGVIFFYIGVFYFNGAYRYLLITNQQLAKSLNTVINGTFNIVFYLFWIYGFACSIQLRKYITL